MAVTIQLETKTPALRAEMQTFAEELLATSPNFKCSPVHPPAPLDDDLDRFMAAFDLWTTRENGTLVAFAFIRSTDGVIKWMGGRQAKRAMIKQLMLQLRDTFPGIKGRIRTKALRDELQQGTDGVIAGEELRFGAYR